MKTNPTNIFLLFFGIFNAWEMHVIVSGDYIRKSILDHPTFTILLHWLRLVWNILYDPVSLEGVFSPPGTTPVPGTTPKFGRSCGEKKIFPLGPRYHPGTLFFAEILGLFFSPQTSPVPPRYPRYPVPPRVGTSCGGKKRPPSPITHFVKQNYNVFMKLRYAPSPWPHCP